jgi:hypothetical protein
MGDLFLLSDHKGARLDVEFSRLHYKCGFYVELRSYVSFDR